ncbi:MAG: hypothetical protein JRE88_08790 [Deltaproteobacteria bacterium]|jgi:hypothetical protein|nr:hypothetical protein [Deltaproteobacteria bacterium]
MTQHRIRNTDNLRVAKIIETRSPAGRHDAVQGWHNLLKDLLSQMAPYLREGHLVTFRELKASERLFFENRLQTIRVPAAAQALYLPPSVRHQMLYQRPAGEPQPVPEHSPDDPPDEGIVLACRKSDVNVVMNALLAKPPFAPAIDVYDDGQLLAGYVYHTIDECITHLAKVMHIHLQPGGRQK